ncbi:MAG: hypothetical protein RJA70_815 [Pseudomonadota bacterium]|jgi:selenocysteine lyase/cysteine desulfurase
MKPALGDRSIFPSLTGAAYLNHAAISPACLPSQLAVRQATDDYARLGFGAFPIWETNRQRLRQHLAQLIGAAPQEIAFGLNTGRGVTDIALCLPWKAKDRVLCFDGEFPANVTAWQQAAKLFDLECLMHQASAFETDEGLEKLELQLRRGLRLVAVSAVQFQTGLRMPLKQMGELCHAYGAELFVDAIQAAGIVPIDVVDEHIDYLSCGGHKWLLGFEGASFVYAKQSCAEKLRPYTAGWTSRKNPIDFLRDGPGLLRYDHPIREDIQFIEGGTMNLLGLAALGATVPMLLELGVGAIFRHVSDYLDQLELGLSCRGFHSMRSADENKRSGIYCVQHPSVNLQTLAIQLRERGVSVGYPDGNLRFAPHFGNRLDEVPVVLDTIDQLLAR